MPYAQWHYPFENKDKIDEAVAFPADFIAEGVDQTRVVLHLACHWWVGVWQYRLKNVVSNGLVLDKNGQKMSKRLGNAVDPETQIPMAQRNSLVYDQQWNPWDNLKFDVEELPRSTQDFWYTIQHLFFSLYANIDGFCYKETDIPQTNNCSDRWFVSTSPHAQVDEHFNNYEPTKPLVDLSFVTEDLSNW